MKICENPVAAGGRGRCRRRRRLRMSRSVAFPSVGFSPRSFCVQKSADRRGLGFCFSGFTLRRNGLRTRLNWAQISRFYGHAKSPIRHTT